MAVHEGGVGIWGVDDDGRCDVCLLLAAGEDDACGPPAPGVKGTEPGRSAIELGDRPLFVGDGREQRRRPSLGEG